MDEARIDRATNRIQGALDRIERAAFQAMERGGDGKSSESEARIRAALEQLDALIESLEA